MHVGLFNKWLRANTGAEIEYYLYVGDLLAHGGHSLVS
jgi:hypothetical protein